MNRKLLTLCIAALAMIGLHAGEAAEPVTPNASNQTKAVLDYIHSIHGEFTLSGQHTARGARNGNDDLAYIVEITGEYPALIGIDVGIYETRFSDAYAMKLENVALDAIDYWREGGLVTLCWHWGAPMMETNSYDGTKQAFDIERALTEDSVEHEAMMKDIEITAECLARLRDEGVVVLWRPLHETCGGWFWWSKQGPDAAKRLWRFLFNELAVKRELNNLIWVYSASTKMKMEWVPDLQFVDLLGVDFYTYEKMIDPALYETLRSAANGRPVALTESDRVPAPSLTQSKGFLWSWFCAWHTEWLRKNTPEQLKDIYRDPYVLNLDDTPDFSRLH